MLAFRARPSYVEGTDDNSGAFQWPMIMTLTFFAI
jgi:hypothetical protein